MADLTIQINGDLKNYEEALNQAREKTEALGGELETISKVAGAAFAVLTAEIGFSVKAFSESQEASNSLTQALQNQGIYSDDLAESYKKQAEELQKLTGIDDDAIIKAQGVLQGMIGNKQISEDLTKAMVDLSVAKKIDLNTTAELIGKGIEGHVGALAKLGIQIDQHLDKEERTAKIVEIVTAKFGDQAEAANSGLGSIKGLHSAFGDFQENIGQRFAPFVEAIIKSMTSFFQLLNENKAVADLATSLLVAGTAVAGLTVAVGLGGMAWLKYQAMMEAAGVATEAMSVATKGLIGATGIGLLLIAVTEIYLNWSTIWPKMQDVYQAFIGNISQLSGGIGKVLEGVFHLDSGKIKEGLGEAKAAILTGYEEISAGAAAIKIKPPAMEQDEDKAELAKVQNQKEIEEEARKQDVLITQQELYLAKLEDQTAEFINLKTEELDTLKEIQDEKNSEIRDELEAHLEQIQMVQATASQRSVAAQTDVNNKILASNKAYQNLDQKDRALFIQQNQAALQNSIQTEDSIKTAYALKEVQADIQRRNQFLMDEQKFGTAYANINAVMHSEIYQGTKTAFSNMVEMQNSHNSTLKAMGKAAAVANIIIKTAESAMSIFTGFSSIPFVGYALGIIGAAAAVAFGAEQVSTVLSAAEGGLVTGGTDGIDSVPAMLMPGELVVPKNNFEEVVGSVRNSRMGITEEGSEMGPPRDVNVMIGFDSRTASQLLTILQIEDSALGISPQGAA